MLSRVQLNIILTHFCLARKLPLPGRWGGARNRPLESAEKIAKAGDEGLVEIEREEVKRKGSDEYDEPPAKKMRVGEEVSMRTGGEDRFSKLEEKRNDDYEDDNFDGLSAKERRQQRWSGQ